MRVALIGPFGGPSLAAAFGFAPTALPPGYPGAPLMTTLAKALVERGHRVAAISTDYTTPVEELQPFRNFKAPGIDIYFCPQRPRSFRSSGGRRGRALDFFRYEREGLGRALEQFAPEVVHAHWTYEFAWTALDSPFPALITAHDSPLQVLRFSPEPYRFARYLMARRVLARCQHLTAVSPDLARDLRSLTSAPVDVVANPIAGAILDVPPCGPEAFESRTLVMVLNGWTKLKNGARALQAFALARRADPTLKLVCLGSNFEAGGLAARWAAANGCADGVLFEGAVPQARLVERLRTSMAMLHPSLLEACSMAIAEAMTVGLPVIAGQRTSGVAWQLDGGRAGILADVTRPAALAEAIGQIGADAATWRSRSDAARTRARQLFSVDQVVGRYVARYGEVASMVEPAAVVAAAR